MTTHEAAGRPHNEGALHGVRVVEAGLLVQGPQAAALLAQMGADVIKVELPAVGDQSRWLPISLDDRRSAYFAGCNRGKRSLALDLRVDAGRQAFLRLVDDADVVITNFTPGTMEGWGLGYDVLSGRNPAIVYCSGSAFGPLGPDSGRAGADLSAQASAGMINRTGKDGEAPTPVASTIADHIASQNIVSGALAALVARGRTGRGQRVDVSLLGSQIWAQASEYSYYLMSGQLPGRANRSNPLIPGLYGIFPTSDGWIAIVGVTDRPLFFGAIGHPELLDDVRFNAGLLTEAKKALLFAELDKVFAERTTSDWCAVLAPTGQRFAPVRNYAQVVDDPQTWINGYFANAVNDVGESVRVVGSPIGFSDTPTFVGAPAPELGQHTEEVLLEIGYSWDDIDRLRTAGAL